MKDKLNKPIIPDPNCCDVWPEIAFMFNWMVYTEQETMASMPHIDTTKIKGKSGNRWFINYCPSCGRDARNRNMKVEDIKG